MDLVDARNNFLTQLDQFLTSLGFSKTDNVYIKEFQVRGQGSTMMINGQRFDQPGQLINVKKEIKLRGEGEVFDDNSTDKFEMIYVAEYNNNERIKYINNAFYYDEIDMFKNLINKS